MTTETNDSYSSNLKTAYHALISEYVLLLRRVASDRSNWMERRLIEDHVRRNLREIMEGFTLFEYYLSNSVQDADLSWLPQERDYLTRLADQLSDFQQQFLALAWKGLTLIFVSAVLQFAGGVDQTQNIPFIVGNLPGILQTLFGLFGVLLLLLGIVIAMAGTIFVNLKRSYLKPGYDEYDRRRRTASQAQEGVNIYKLENDLYELLERKKPRETPWDVVGWIIVGVLIIGVVVTVFLSVAPGAPNPYAPWAIILIVLILLGLSLGPEIMSRLKRDR